MPLGTFSCKGPWTEFGQALARVEEDLESKFSATNMDSPADCRSRGRKSYVYVAAWSLH